MSKTITQLIPLQYINGTVVVSSIVDVTGHIAATVEIGYCQTNTTGNLANAPKFRVEGQYDDTARFWLPLSTWEPKTTSPVSAQILNIAHAGTTVLDIDTVPTSWRADQGYFIRHQIDASLNDLTKCEFVRLLRTTSSPNKAYLQYPTTLNHTDSVDETSYLYNNAERWISQLNLVAVSKFRVVIDASMCDREIVSEVYLTLLDPT